MAGSNPDTANLPKIKMACKHITDYQVVKNQDDYKNGLIDLCTMQHLAKKTGQAFKVIYRCYERAYSRGYLDYGVTLRTAWLTDKGEQLLKNQKPE